MKGIKEALYGAGQQGHQAHLEHFPMVRRRPDLIRTTLGEKRSLGEMAMRDQDWGRRAEA